jgi:hypothetical protein
MTDSKSLFAFLRSPRQWLAHRRAHRAALAMWERARQPRPERDPLWRDFAEACLQADGERLADIGDLIVKGVPVEFFRLTENERLVVDAYIGGARDV